MSLPPSPTRSALALAAVYFSYLGALGVYGPFLAVYLRHRGLGPSDAAFVLALLPFARVLVTPLWTLLADATHSSRAVLRVVGLGSLAAFGAVALARDPLALTLALVAFAAFRAPATSLIDVLALDWAARNGGQFGRLRAWGTVGYTAGIFAVGLLVGRRGPPVIVQGALAMLALTAVVSFAVPREQPAAPHAHGAPPPARVPVRRALAVLVRRPRFVLFLATASLHQLGLGAYDTLFADHLTRLASAEYAGVAVACGAAAEVVFMTRARGVLGSLGVERTLLLAYAGSAARWLVLALAHDPRVLVPLQLLHALTYGAFYMAGVALVDEESPPEVRATAQGIFAMVVWGLATSLALVLAGWLARLGGMRAIFLAASAASAASALLALGLARARR